MVGTYLIKLKRFEWWPYLVGGFLSPLTLKEDDKLLSLIPEDRPRDKLDMTNRSVADLALKLGVL